MMNILGIDTSTRTMSIALLSDEKILGEVNFYSNMDHSEKLIENISYLMKSNDMNIDDLDLVGVAIGPGSFTGVRIGISTVKGLVEFKDIPVAAVSSLEILSRNFSSSNMVSVAVDAKRDRVYGGIYDYTKDGLQIFHDLISLDEFLMKLDKYEDDQLIIVGDLNNTIKDRLENKYRYAKEGNLINRASNLCFIAKDHYMKKKVISHMELQANYMSKSQAQIDFEKRKDDNKKS